MSKSFSSKRFRNIGVLTIASVYFLILVGGIVRSTGSGMGCPDWPKCFGMWVPPTTLEELPDNYLEVYQEKRIAKNKRMGNMLGNLGFTQAAKEIFDHPNQYIETAFNPTKTWIEYINRLVGVTIGILIFLTVIFAWPYRKQDPKVFWAAFASFLLVGFQGWLGSLVVSTNLLPEMVTVHMALSLVLLALLIYCVVRAKREQIYQEAVTPESWVMPLLIIGLILTFVQIILGTQVREEVDMIAFNMDGLNREGWIGQLSSTFYVHRSLSILFVLVNVALVFKINQLQNQALKRLGFWLVVSIGLEILVGIILAYFALPAFAQPLHLVIGTAIFGIQFLLLMQYFYAQNSFKRFNGTVA
ncbi:cytochrome oxidase assembly protein [Rufibacter sp. DG15C]|uniref:COX15/CtaA family protein n=1 Tax=Rufibacter sp. DG15C TaxID=1379909 RepID=UPI00078EC7F1|nr:COX15/CtaA family protein [Rufibacter sp. DG15C]AMM50072.1 cytochrome oxidase assembly protein [Rufibacter sp. DG15C]